MLAKTPQRSCRLRGFPEISREELIRFLTLSAADEAFVRSMRRPATVLGVAVQLCALPWLGFVPDEVGAAPVVAVTRLASRLGMPAGELAGYGPVLPSVAQARKVARDQTGKRVMASL